MKIKDILFIIKKRYLILILFPVITGIVTAYYNYFMLSDIYQAQVKFIVARDATAASGETISQSELSLWQSLVGDFTYILISDACIDATAEALSDKYESIPISSSMIAPVPADSSRMITVTVTGPEPNMVCDFANELINQFSILVDEKLNMKYVVIIDEAKVNPYPIFPNRKQNISMAVIAGFMAAIALCFLLEFTDMSLRTNEDVDKHLGLPVLARIPRYY